MTKLDVLSEQTGPDLTPLARQIGDAKNGIAANRQISRQKTPEFFDCLVISDHSEDQNRS